ncbi:phosphatase PAP2 family protein [Paraburkholderia caribensis]|uniref:Phosphatase PAP2 family protein n=1 Tax=Paraburkholderia caribensis TaxID=75105 RepID=A0ABV0DTC7_9BURK|nr:phosphatase PAP2 family protein [Paraburkholderia caribensis]MCO4876927.1 phosphatase PAP2 family protein [Paraburkholderia caribensis]PTB30864.1 phosphoesterase [Paraburkholderia caribensis]
MWNAISNVGDAALTLPLAMACAVWLRLCDPMLARRWVFLLSIGAALVGATKILYAGCGISISAIGFRVISGHTMLATSVWTVLLALVCQAAGASIWKASGVGLVIGALTAMARVLDHAHTVSEVVAGWTVGATVGILFIGTLGRSRTKLFRPLAAAGTLFLITSLAYGHHAPIQRLIDEHSHYFCARIA